MGVALNQLKKFRGVGVLLGWIGIVLTGSMSLAEAHSCSDWERVSLPDVSSQVSQVQLELDGQNRPHVLFFDVSRGVTRYAVKKRKGWVLEDVGMGRAILALDAADVPHLAWVRCEASQGCNLVHGLREDDGWKMHEVGEVTGQVSAPAMVFDSRGLPHIVYYSTEGAAGMIRHATVRNGSWSTRSAYKGMMGMGPPDIEIDGDGAIHLVFTEVARGHRMVHVTQKDEVWLNEVLPLGRGKGPRWDEGPYGHLYVSFFLNGQRVAANTPKGWVEYGQPLDGAGPVDLAPDGVPHVALIHEDDDVVLKRLSLVWWIGDRWTESLVAADPGGFREVALSMDETGCGHLLYQHYKGSTLVYARPMKGTTAPVGH